MNTNGDKLQRPAEVALLLALSAAALALRLAHLGAQSLWVDEANTYLQNYGSLGQMLARARTIAVDFPLDRLFQNAVAVWPINEFLLRLPAALFGVLAVPLTYALSRRVWGRRAALLAAGLLALSPYHIRYSQEARNYSGFLVFHLLTLICLWEAARRPSWGRWAAYAGAAALLLYDHIYAVVALGLQWGFHVLILGAGALRRRQGRALWAQLRPARQQLLALIAAGALFLPWAFLVLTAGRAGASLAQGAGAWRALSAVQFDLDLFLRMLRWFSGNADALTPLFFLIVGAGALTIAAPGRRGLAALTWAYIGLALLGVAVGARLGNNYVGYRRLLFLLPLLLVLAGAGFDALLRLTLDRRPPWRQAWLLPTAGLILLVAALAAPAIAGHYRAEKENWRGLTDILRREAKPADLIINYAVSRESSRALETYLGADLAGLAITPAAAVLRGELPPAASPPATVWQIFPFPLEPAGAERWELNHLGRLRTLDGDASLAPLQMMLALERVPLAGSPSTTLRELTLAGLERTARIEMPIFLSWRFSAVKVLADEYQRQGQPERALDLYRALAGHPAVPAEVRANLRSIADYLEQRLTRSGGLIIGGYWADETLRQALEAALARRGLPKPNTDAEWRAVTKALAGAAPAGPNLARAGAFAGDWLAAWKLRLRDAGVQSVRAGCPAGAPTCLRIKTTGAGYQGDLRQTIYVEAGALYLLRCALRTEATLGLQGKALYVEYARGGGMRGVYASAFWGNAESQTFVALFAPPAGVQHIALSPVLIDDAGILWLSDVQMIPLTSK